MSLKLNESLETISRISQKSLTVVKCFFRVKYASYSAVTSKRNVSVQVIGKIARYAYLNHFCADMSIKSCSFVLLR